MVVQDRLLSARLGAHPFGAGFLSCEERRSQRAAEIIILPAISFRPNLFVFARYLSSSFVPFKHDVILGCVMRRGAGFIGLAPPPALSSCLNGDAFAATRCLLSPKAKSVGIWILRTGQLRTRNIRSAAALNAVMSLQKLPGGREGRARAYVVMADRLQFHLEAQLASGSRRTRAECSRCPDKGFCRPKRR